MVHVNFKGRLIFIGFGCVGQAVLPLILRHIGGLKADRITILTADDAGKAEADHYGIRVLKIPLTEENYKKVLDRLVEEGDFVLNLSVDVSSTAIISFCQEKKALYLDTCIEPWAGRYHDRRLPPSERTNYALREEALALRSIYPSGPTAVLTHGANPGLVSHFVKQALLNIANDTGLNVREPQTREEWARLAWELDVKVIHISEKDSQISKDAKGPGEFVNTWSVDGFISEGAQPAELGWGTHEKHFPHDGQRHDFGSQSAIYLNQPGCNTRVRTWSPISEYFHGFLITHAEAISIADYFTVKEGVEVVYRPTVHYSYHPSDNAILSVHEFCGRNYQPQAKKRIMMDDIIGGIDELGVLICGHKKNAYWYGSQLSTDEARKLCPYNTATTLQIASAVLAGVVWAMKNPGKGIVEPDAMDFHSCLKVAMPYLGPLVGEYTDWNPLYQRKSLFNEDIDELDPWQFKNVRV